MPRNPLLRDMVSAPRDGTTIEVRHGPKQELVLAHWSGQIQAFIADDDPLRRALHRVTGGGRQSGEADNRRAILLNQHVQFISNGAKVPVQDLHECVPPGSLVGEDSSTIERITAETQQIPIAKIVQRLRHQ